MFYNVNTKYTLELSVLESKSVKWFLGVVHQFWILWEDNSSTGSGQMRWAPNTNFMLNFNCLMFKFCLNTSYLSKFIYRLAKINSYIWDTLISLTFCFENILVHFLLRSFLLFFQELLDRISIINTTKDANKIHFLFNFEQSHIFGLRLLNALISCLDTLLLLDSQFKVVEALISSQVPCETMSWYELCIHASR